MRQETVFQYTECRRWNIIPSSMQNRYLFVDFYADPHSSGCTVGEQKPSVKFTGHIAKREQLLSLQGDLAAHQVQQFVGDAVLAQLVHY